MKIKLISHLKYLKILVSQFSRISFFLLNFRLSTFRVTIPHLGYFESTFENFLKKKWFLRLKIYTPEADRWVKIISFEEIETFGNFRRFIKEKLYEKCSKN